MTTYQWLRYLSGLSSPSPPSRLAWTGGERVGLCIALIVLLQACSPASILKAGLGAATGNSGTSVVANVPIGKEVSQTLGVKTSKDNTVTLRPKSRVETIDQSSADSKVDAKTIENLTIQTNVPYWFVGLFIFILIMWSWLLWKLPSPDQIWKNIKK